LPLRESPITSNFSKVALFGIEAAPFSILNPSSFLSASIALINPARSLDHFALLIFEKTNSWKVLYLRNDVSEIFDVKSNKSNNSFCDASTSQLISILCEVIPTFEVPAP
jgi:hypothetical protein